MRISSSAFADGEAVPRRFTCDGENLSPPIAWTDAPAATRSFVLLCDDPDAPRGTWRHWAAYDIGPAHHALAEGAAMRAEGEFRQAVNDFGRSGYGGPCPPHGDGPHHYHFRLLALDTERLPVSTHASCRDVEHEARGHVLAEASLIGLYER